MRRLRLLCTTALLLAAPRALAQDAESKAAAESLFRDGVAAFEAGDLASACPKLEGAVALTGGEALGGVLVLARCYERQGRLASAWATFHELAAKARTAGQTERAGEAEAGAARLLPGLHYVRLAVPDAVATLPGAQMTRGERPVRPELWASRFPVDAGSITFTITAPSKRPSTRTVAVPEGPGETVVAFEPLADDGPAALPLSPPTGMHAGAAPKGADSASHEVSRWSAPRTFGAVLATAGAATMAAGVVIGVVAKGQYDDATGDPEACDALAGGGFACGDPAPADDARALGDAGTVTFLVGSGMLVGGALTYLLAPSAAHGEAAIPRLQVGREGAALSWRGVF